MKYRKTRTHYGIDAGELAGLSRAKCFVLGVEFELFKRRIDDHMATGCGITTTVHSVNVERLAGVLDDHGITYQRKWLNDDWVDITVKPTDNCQAMRAQAKPRPTLAMVLVWFTLIAYTIATAWVSLFIFG